MRGRMYPSVGNVIWPGDKPVLHLLETIEGLSLQEGIPDIAHSPLDLALGLGMIGLADPWRISIASGEVQQRGVEDDFFPVMFQCDDLGVVIEDLFGDATEEGEGMLMAGKKGRRCLICDHFGILHKDKQTDFAVPNS